MKKKLVLCISIIVCIAVFIGVYLLYNNLSDNHKADNLAPAQNDNSTSQYSGETTDRTAPDFTAQNQNGSDVTLSGYFGKPIVLNLWASWCGPCKNEMPYFEEAYKENEDIQFLMVNLTQGDDIDSAKDFIKENNFTFPVLYDIYGEAAYMYQAEALPMTIFIDKNGDMVTYGVGAFDEAALQDGIDMIKE